MLIADTDSPSGANTSSVTLVLSEGLVRTDVHIQAGSDGTIHQTMNGGGISAGRIVSFSSDMTMTLPDGPGSATTVNSSSDLNTTITVTAKGSLKDPGTNPGFVNVTMTNDKTCESVSETQGINSAGESFHSAGASDGQGNESQTTITEHADGGFSITTVSKDSDGNVTINSEDFDKDGNKIQPG
jgi:hypothetical protein